jgi:DNA polymerase III alpha subunit
MMGFFACKGIGYEIGEIIEKERKDNGLFKSLEDFLTRCHTIINKKSLESLIKA